MTMWVKCFLYGKCNTLLPKKFDSKFLALLHSLDELWERGEGGTNNKFKHKIKSLKLPSVRSLPSPKAPLESCSSITKGTEK